MVPESFWSVGSLNASDALLMVGSDSLAFIGRHLYAGEDKGRDYGCSAEGANLAVNLSGKRTLIGRNSGERRPYWDGHQRGKPII
ncbi:hypothetical protein SRABI96_01332 [Peribacillus sp. Bi96]|nr:hypothetical protein SRABI96_01332 [Peribacillus sp. Bi96]